MSERLLSVGDVTALLGVNRDIVYKLFERNRLPALKVARPWKFRQPEIDIWLDKQVGRKRPNQGERPSPEGGQ